MSRPRVVAWRSEDWTGVDWRELDEPLDEQKFAEFIGETDDDGAEEGTYAAGEVRLEDGSVHEFHVEKSYSVDYTMWFTGEP
jgi:hypothetical protein